MGGFFYGQIGLSAARPSAMVNCTALITMPGSPQRPTPAAASMQQAAAAAQFLRQSALPAIAPLISWPKGSAAR